jgi:putative MATE family efflux protein
MFFERLVRSFDGVFEIFWIGILGAKALAAYSLGYLFILFLRSFGMGIRIAGQSLVAHAVGSKDFEKASIVSAQMIILLFAYSVTLSLVGFFFTPFIISIMNLDTQVTGFALDYMKSGFISLIAIEAMFVFGSVFRGTGEPGILVVSMIVGTIVSVIAMPLFMFGFGSFEGIGIAGSFFGLGLGRLVGFLIMLFYLLKGWSQVFFKLRFFRPNLGIISSILSIAWPATVQNLLERGSYLLLLRILTPFGADALAAWGVGNRVTMIARLPCFGLQGSTRTLVGQNLGASKPNRAVRTVQYTLTILVGIMGFLSVAQFLFSRDISIFFGLVGSSTSVASFALRVFSFGLIMESIRRVMAGAFQGAGNSKPPMLTQIIISWILMLPTAFYLSNSAGLREEGVWFAMLLAQCTGGCILFLWFFSWMKTKTSVNLGSENV